jgi:glycerol-3-phosphate dehydrogenase
VDNDSAERRDSSLDRLANGHVDLLVIGAGIVGSRVAYEAARAGLSVALVDAGDFGGGTSSASSKLFHGGLRYLATGDLRLVRELQIERRALATRIAPHLARPLPLVLAVRRSHRARIPKLWAALGIYFLVSGLSRPFPRFLRPDRARELLPLDASATLACGLIHETYTHDARLTLATVRAAAEAGAITLNYVRAVALERARGRIVAAVLRDVRTGGELTLRCGAVVSATGPWVDRVRRLEDPRARARLRGSARASTPSFRSTAAGVPELRSSTTPEARSRSRGRTCSCLESPILGSTALLRTPFPTPQTSRRSSPPSPACSQTISSAPTGSCT